MERFLREKLKGGTFGDVSAVRSRTMGVIRGRGNRTTETRLRFALVRAGLRGWRMHAADLPGKPDFYFPASRLVVFVDGCFWHGCPRCGHTPRTNRPFWSAKIARNRERDQRVVTALTERGITAIRLWECALARGGLLECVARIRRAAQRQ